MLKLMGCYRLPEWSIGYFLYGEVTDLTDEEIKLLKDFESSFGGGITVSLQQDYEPYFCGSNDIDKLRGNVVDVEIFITEKE